MDQARSNSVAPAPALDLAKFFVDLGGAVQRLLLLDYDGTLAPFHVQPERALPYEGVRERLDAIMRDPASYVVMVTGRPARELGNLLRLQRMPSVWGSHGWEYLNADGEYRLGPLDPRPLRRILRDRAFEQRVRELGGRIEQKPSALAIHWRGAAPAQVAELRDAVRSHWLAHDLGATLSWLEFDGGIELRLPGRDKGSVVETLLAAYPRAVAAYLGDDLTDEDAFRAIRDRGAGILVRPEYRPTFARAWLRPPEQLLDFLDRWIAVARGGRL